MKHRIGIIGGAGFVGSSIARHFLEDFEVKVLDAKTPPRDLERLVIYTCCDIRNYEEVLKGIADVDIVIHAAIVQIPLINEQKSLGYQVNVIGTQNICKAVDESPNVRGMILAGSWHTIGEKDLKGVIDEEFGFRPDKVEDRARLYALSKIAQESVVRYYDEMSNKIYGIIRMGTILGEGMSEKTAASIFIDKGLNGGPITPYKHSMYRPMLYANIDDICRAFEAYTRKILCNEIKKKGNSLEHIVNVYYPEPVTILDLAEIVKDSIIEFASGEVRPKVEIVGSDVSPLFAKEDKNRTKVDITKAKRFLGLKQMTSPRESIREIVKLRVHRNR